MQRPGLIAQPWISYRCVAKADLMEGRRNTGILGFFYNVMPLSLTLVFAAASAFFFLLAWGSTLSTQTLLESAEGLVGAGRFELPTPCAQGRCATRLRYAPTSEALLILNHFPHFRHRPGSPNRAIMAPTVAKP